MRRRRQAQCIEKALADKEIFLFFLIDHGEIVGMCHGAFFETFWMCGLTCYVSSLMTRKDLRCRGYGKAMLEHAEDLARAKGCRALILDSAFFRTVITGFGGISVRSSSAFSAQRPGPSGARLFHVPESIACQNRDCHNFIIYGQLCYIFIIINI